MKGNLRFLFIAIICGVFQPSLWAQGTELVPVVEKAVSRMVELPGEFQPFLSVDLHARVAGYVERVLVDRGSVVKQGDLLVELSAPEMKAQIAESDAKVHAAEAERIQAEAQLASAQSTYDRMKEASKTPGAIAGNELVTGEKQVDAMKALLEARVHAAQAAKASLEALETMESFLKVTAPFDGVVTERRTHPGALVGPNADSVLLELQQVATLRLVVAVPEDHVGGIVSGATVAFRVPAFPGRTFSGTVARVSRILDPKTRTMPVELDVTNNSQQLAPGMFPTVSWPVRNGSRVLSVPRSSVVTTTERTFVIREKDGRAEWVDVQKGSADGDLIRVIGALKAGDMVVKRATDEIREGSALRRQPSN